MKSVGEKFQAWQKKYLSVHTLEQAFFAGHVEGAEHRHDEVQALQTKLDCAVETRDAAIAHEKERTEYIKTLHAEIQGWKESEAACADQFSKLFADHRELRGAFAEARRVIEYYGMAPHGRDGWKKATKWIEKYSDLLERRGGNIPDTTNPKTGRMDHHCYGGTRGTSCLDYHASHERDKCDKAHAEKGRAE
jgi:hypothetical protein